MYSPSTEAAHVSILIPQSSVLPNSVIGLFKIFDLANQYALKRGRGVAFDLHLIGTANTVELYGGHFSVKPDLALAEVAATDVAIIPAMAGNIAGAIQNNSAFIAWIREKYRAGSEIAGVCTGALFLADAGVINEKSGFSRWFVDATFRKQYSRINSLAEEAADSAGSIHSDSGAWCFFQRLLDRVAGNGGAWACSANFQDAFNRDCQSIVSVCDSRRQRAKGIDEERAADCPSLQPMTKERFLSLFKVNHADPEDALSIDTLFEDSLRTPATNTSPGTCRSWSEDHREGRADHRNTRTLKALLKKVERLEKGYGNA